MFFPILDSTKQRSLVGQSTIRFYSALFLSSYSYLDQTKILFCSILPYIILLGSNQNSILLYFSLHTPTWIKPKFYSALFLTTNCYLDQTKILFCSISPYSRHTETLLPGSVTLCKKEGLLFLVGGGDLFAATTTVSQTHSSQ